MNQKIFERISYHAVYDKSILEAISFASKNGFTGIQIAMDSPHFSFESITPKEILKIKTESKKLGIRLSLHAPDVASLIFPYSNTSKGIISYYSDLIDFAKKIDAAIITIHPGVPTLFPTDTRPQKMFPDVDIEAYRKILCQNLDKLLELNDNKVMICIENYELQPFVLEVLQNYVNKTELKLCWDFSKMHNKTDGSIKPEIKDFFIRNLSAVKQVHLHSLINGKSHRVIQEGLIDFKYYLGLLNGFDVLDYCIEVRPREKALESLQNLKKMLSKNLVLI